MTEPRKPRRRRKILLGLGAGALLLLLGTGAASAYFFRPQPVPPAPELIALSGSAAEGSYLAKVGNCAACHTVPGGPAFAGGVRFKTDFGTIYSTNITPDREHGIGGWSFAAFHRAMKHGIGDGGEHLYPAFPYTSFAQLSDNDIASLYNYFSTVAPAAVPNRANAMDFPFGNRSLLHFWKRLYHKGETFASDPARGEAWNRGAYLVEGLAHCGACHTPRGVLGGPDESRALQGGTYIDAVANGGYRTWSAVDLTPGLHGLDTWSESDLVAYLTHGKNPRSVVHGPMNEVFRSTAALRPADAAAMAAYLKGVEPSQKRGSWTGASLLGGRKSAGEVVYTVHCGTCHLPDGKGDKILGVSLARNPIVQAESPASLINVILYGPDLPPPPFVSGRTRMKPFGKRLSDEDIASLTTYLRSSFGNRAGAVSPEDVAVQR